MAPKKREKELDKNRMDHAQADHELFLQAFESKLEFLIIGTYLLLMLNCNFDVRFITNYYMKLISANVYRYSLYSEKLKLTFAT